MSYNEETILKALERINSNDETQKLSIRKAAALFKIPKSTLSDRQLNGNAGVHGTGKTTALSQFTEQLLVKMISVFGERGYGLTFNDLQSIIMNYLIETNQQNLFKGGKPSKKWWYDFLKRHESEISKRKGLYSIACYKWIPVCWIISIKQISCRQNKIIHCNNF